MSWAAGLIVVIVLAIFVPWLVAELTPPSRRWLRRLHAIERARLDWRARVIRDQCYWREGQP